MKTLIVYYSWHNGNTKRIAEMIHEKVDADICRIDTLKPYPSVYRQASDQGKRECENRIKPEIRPMEYDISDYECIIVGTPTWWYTMAPAVRTFLSDNNWKGKTVIPFMTNAGWPGTVIKDMMELCSEGNVVCANEIRFDSEGGSQLVTPLSDIDQWIGLIKEQIES